MATGMPSAARRSSPSRGSERMNVASVSATKALCSRTNAASIQPGPTTAFAQGGNVVGFPLDTVAEIDPFLSALAGQPSPLPPSLLSPTRPLPTSPLPPTIPPSPTSAAIRTLRPDSRTYDLTGTFATRLAPWLTGMRACASATPTAARRAACPRPCSSCPTTNPIRPFSTDVGLALYGGRALIPDRSATAAKAPLTLNGTFGRWTSHFNARHLAAKDETLTQRQGSSALSRSPTASTRSMAIFSTCADPDRQGHGQHHHHRGPAVV